MIIPLSRRLRAISLILYRTLLRRRGMLIRGSLCWALGISFLVADQNAGQDLRLQLRGPVSAELSESRVATVHIDEPTWEKITGLSRSRISPVPDYSIPTDSYFWNGRVWRDLLGELLAQEPTAIIVSFFFGPALKGSAKNYRKLKEFNDPRIFWLSRLNADDQEVLPLFGADPNKNMGLINLVRDSDGLVRRYNFDEQSGRSLISNAIEASKGRDLSRVGKKYINFQGAEKAFPDIKLVKLLRGLPQGSLKGKIIVIGGAADSTPTYRTPLGTMTKTQVVANISDNAASKRWIVRLPTIIYVFFLLLLLIVSIRIMSNYPQFVALVFLFWIVIGVSVASILLFDQFSIWLPVRAPLVQLSVTYIVFLSFQLTVSDYQKWQLENERKFLLEVEQLKNNFVSLFSHDLKNPIAKIQAICDRLLNQYKEDPLSSDVTALRQEASELHQYIQKILQITRVEARDFKIKKDAEDLNMIVADTVRRLTPLAKARNIQILEDLEPMFLIEMDKALITEVTINLIDNAIKYSPEGCQINVTTREVDHRVTLTVEDQGKGISHEEQRKIFDKFYRGESQRDATKGSGLGLYLSKYFIELHGGEVFLESRPGDGTKVGFSLPVDTD